MFGVIDDIEDYNRRFNEETKDYKKFCKGKECECVEECGKQGKIVFCERDDEEKILYYIKGRIDSGVFSFNDLCRKDDFPIGGIGIEILKKYWEHAKEEYPYLLPESIDIWIDELKQMGMFKEG